METTTSDLRSRVLPEDAKLWIFAFTESLSDAKANELKSRVHAFAESWRSHGDAIEFGIAVEHGRFLLVAAKTEEGSPSGCATDNLFRKVTEIGREIGLSVGDNANLVYFLEQDGGRSRVRSVSRGDFGKLVESKAVTAETPVFDNGVAVLRDYLAGRWLLPMKDSWHSRVWG